MTQILCLRSSEGGGKTEREELLGRLCPDPLFRGWRAA